MPLCDTLLRAAEAGLYNIHFSQEILDGATRNLVKNEVMTSAQAAYFQEQIKIHFPEGLVEVPANLITAMTNDPRDRHVVAAAIVAKADLIVTDNLDDFPVETLAPWSIEAWHPDDFLVDLDEQFPGKLMKIIQQQSADLRHPPVTVTDLLDKLEKNNRVAKFARTIRCQIYSDVIIQIINKALDIVGRPAPEGGRYFEGERYRLWYGGKILTVTAKDNRGEILRCENGAVGGKLSSADIEAFQIFEQTLEQELTQVQK
jgi:predicted nucleic acid-binding protein